MENDIEQLLASAAEHDPALTLPGRLLPGIKRKRVHPTSFSREILFTKMAQGKPVLFKDYPAPVHPGFRRSGASILADVLRSSSSRKKYRVRSGPSRTSKYFTLSEIISRWDRDRSLLGVTDLHIRKTAFEKVVDPDRLAPFNLLSRSAGEIARLEMMTAVISTTNSWTDSHSDDPDGTNHCFAGRKLWLLWDTFKGLDAGLDDVQRVKLPYKPGKFDIEAFVQLKSAKWLLVEPGYTLFLPGNYTHRVFTLERYLGIGTFYVSLPNCLRTLSRWILWRPTWEQYEPASHVTSLVRDIGRLTARAIDTFDTAPLREKSTMGHDFLGYSIKEWRRSFIAEDKAQLLESVEFRELASAALR